MNMLDSTVGGIIGYLVAEKIGEKPDGIRVSVVPQKPSPASGRVYENEHVMENDEPFRLFNEKTMLSDVVIYVSTNALVVGSETNQRFPLTVGASLSLRVIDLSGLWFRNAAVGSNGKFNIIGTRLE